MTACPPPPGRCTSRSTTSGRVARMTATASSTESASPTTSMVGAPTPDRVSSDRTPARMSAWSSTSTRRIGAGHGWLLGMRISTSVPTPGWLTTVAFPPARSARPTTDSVIPLRSVATDSGSKPIPVSRT